MTVSTSTSRIAYTGNGVTTSFSVPFPFIQDDYLIVIRTVISTGVETILILDSPGADGYSVTGAGEPTGRVIVVTAPTALERLSIIRSVDATQEADFVANDPLPSEVIEDSLDKLTMLVGDIAVGNGLSRVPILYAGDIDGSGRYNSNGNRYSNAADGVNPDDLATVQQVVAAGSGNFIQAGSGSVIRTMQDKAREIISVKDFGAVGDGITDDTAAIQLAMDAVGSGGMVVFPFASYACNNNVSLSGKTNIKIEGHGSELVLPASPSVVIEYCLDIISCSAITVSGLKFHRSQSTTPGQDYNGIRIRSCQNIVVRDCDFSDTNNAVAVWAQAADTTGIVIDGCTATGVLPYSAIDDAAQRLQGELLFVQDGGAFHCRDIVVRNCIVTRVNMLALCEAGTERMIVENNIVRESHDSSIYLRSAGSSIRGNTIYHAGKDAIKSLVGATSADPRRVLISDNNVYGAGINKSDGGTLINSDATNAVIANNVLETTASTTASAGQVAIFVANSNTVVSGNSIKGNGSTARGVYIRTDLGDINLVRVDNNVMELAGGNGVTVQYSSTRYIRNTAITNNTIKGALVGVYINDGASGVQVEDILVARNKITASNESISLRGIVRPVIVDNEMTLSTGTFFLRIGSVTDAIIERNTCDASAVFRTISGATPTYRRRGKNLRDGQDQDAFVALTSGDTTPSVTGARSVRTANAAPTTITALDDGQMGMAVVVLFGDANTTVDFTGTTLKGNVGVDWTPANGDHMVCQFDGTNWYCAISDNTA